MTDFGHRSLSDQKSKNIDWTNALTTDHGFNGRSILSNIAVGWLIIFCLIVFITAINNNEFSIMPQSLKKAHYCISTSNLYFFIDIISAAILSRLLVEFKFEIVTFFSLLISFSVLMIFLILTMLRSGFAIQGPVVLIQPPELWKPTNSTGIGNLVPHGQICQAGFYKSVLSYSLLYDINYMESSKSKTVNIAYGVTPSNIGHWISMMKSSGAPHYGGQIVTSAGIGSVELERPFVSPVQENHFERCIAYFSRDLNSLQQQQLRSLVGP